MVGDENVGSPCRFEKIFLFGVVDIDPVNWANEPLKSGAQKLALDQGKTRKAMASMIMPVSWEI
jgi:hypothetical protein